MRGAEGPVFFSVGTKKQVISFRFGGEQGGPKGDTEGSTVKETEREWS